MDERDEIHKARDEIHKAVKDLLIAHNYDVIYFCFEEDQPFSINYCIQFVMNNKIITINLLIDVYSNNENNLFDEIDIANDNDTLFLVKYEDMPEEFCKDKIIELIRKFISEQDFDIPILK